MKKFNTIGVIAIALFFLLVTMNFSRGGFRSNNSVILARSITITSTIDGKVDNNLPEIGQKVGKSELLVSLINSRIDKSRLVDFQTQISFVTSEIYAFQSQQRELDSLYKYYKKRAVNYEKWMLKDTQFKEIAQSKHLKEARKVSEVNSQNAKRVNALYKSNHASDANVQQVNAEAIIAKTQVEINATELKRSQLLLDSITNNGVFFEDGETSYWEKMLDTVKIKNLDVTSRLNTLNSELHKLQIQEKAEKKRIDSSISEELLSPFKGIVSSIYVSNKTNVSSGTSLLQISDCSNPIVIIPIPEFNIGDFNIGMKVSITPIDSSKIIMGKISYISSGPMLAADKTMLLQNDMTINGNKAVVRIDDIDEYNKNSKTCDISRKATVVIHT